MEHLDIYHPFRVRGRVALPASKSISNRALIINALSGGTQLPENLSDCDDTRVMLRALQEMPETIDIGAAGTAMRFLTAYLSVTPGTHVITGTERMRHRPIGILVDALRELGAHVEYVGEEGFPPLRITGRTDLVGGELTVPGNVSSQYISALLMIAPTLKRGLQLTLTGEIASRPYLDMTLTMMGDFGAETHWVGEDVIEVRPVPYKSRPYFVESDWSAASYWYEMVALTEDMGADIELPGLNLKSMQGDCRVWELFCELGVVTEFYRDAGGTPVVRLSKGNGVTDYFVCDFTHQPDLAQTLAVTCAMLGVPFRLRGLHSLRIKETDRIAALCQELGKLVAIETEDDDLVWEGFYRIDMEDCPDCSLVFDTYEDHRMAMALAPVALCLNSRVRINNPEVVSKSYPTYWTDLEEIGFRISK
ncbi:MAG: 3-phosphoshikimate 1-carboxyvinyltransferase [Bacteroidaceae bacterium]|nr:3-phosphoshikimate 1-carboxyvinyltransferase [Bacteroidaceae bacterium]